MRMMNQSKTWAFWRWFEIADTDNPDATYLRRLYLVKTPWFGWYIHWIYLPDNDRSLHNHPWTFYSLILKGGYIETLMPASYELEDANSGIGKLRLPSTWNIERKRWSIHKHPLNLAHSIDMVKPDTVTMCLVGRKKCEWGFFTDTGFVHWTRYTPTKK